VALPAYNEGPRLPKLLHRWIEVLNALSTEHRFVLVDDGSTDDTPEILRAFAAENEAAHIITHTPNQGLGTSLRDALKYVADNGDPDDVVVTMDADNTHPPELLPSMLERLTGRPGCPQQQAWATDAPDVVIASRYRTGAQSSGLTTLRRLTSFGARVLFQVIYPIRNVRDYTCGYRAYRVAIIQRAFEAYGPRFCDRPGFECTADIVLRLAKIGATFDEVPISLTYDAKAGASHLPIGRTILKTLGLLLTRRLERRSPPPHRVNA
jgi:dolichol-phosphate mannosyltransferase